MSTVIKGGTIVTADLSFSSDVLVENGKISLTNSERSEFKTCTNPL